MFKKLAALFAENTPKKPASVAATGKAGVKAVSATPSHPSDTLSEDDPATLIAQAILEAKQTIAMEEKIAGRDPDHLKAVQDAMMIYRQKQAQLDHLPAEEKARLRALGEVIFGARLSNAEKNSKKTH